MRWHKEKYHDETNVLRHPVDSENWKEFDKNRTWFAQEPRNVRLGLATDGFNTFGKPIILFSYNLPPWKCFTDPFTMMSLLIPGPQTPGKDIDVYLRPLVDELKELWTDGIETFDASMGKYFKMHAAILWTINDFSAYGKCLTFLFLKVCKLSLVLAFFILWFNFFSNLYRSLNIKNEISLSHATDKYVCP